MDSSDVALRGCLLYSTPRLAALPTSPGLLLSEVFSYPRSSLFGTRSRVAAIRGFLLSEVLLSEVFQMVQRLLAGIKSRIALIRGVLLNGSAAKRGVL
jgi:hypothetical protein